MKSAFLIASEQNEDKLRFREAQATDFSSFSHALVLEAIIQIIQMIACVELIYRI